jgi:hypothetical protein
MQTLIYTLRVQTTKANAGALLEYFDRHSLAQLAQFGGGFRDF